MRARIYTTSRTFKAVDGAFHGRGARSCHDTKNIGEHIIRIKVTIARYGVIANSRFLMLMRAVYHSRK